MLVFLLIIFTALSVASVTRIITDSSDNDVTFIRNSNGGYWELNGGNIQNAIDDISDTGGTVWLPSGTISISSVISVPSNVKIEGTGMDSTILEMSSSGSFPTGCVYLYHVEHVILSDFSVDGNKNGGATGNMMYVSEDCRNISISRIHLYDGNNAGLRCYRASDIHVSDCFIHVDCASNQALSLAQTDDSIFSDITLINPSLQALDIASCDNSIFNDIIIKDSAYGMKICGADSISNNNTFNNFNIFDITSQEGLRMENCRDISISNFCINNVGNDGITLYSSAQRITFTNLNIHTCGDKGIILVGGPDDIVITNSIIRNCDDDAIQIDSGADNFIIMGNNWDGVLDDNSGASNSVIENNIGSIV